MIEKNKLNDAVICKEDDSAFDVSRIMRDTQNRHIIVVDNELKPLGIISTFDINNRVVAEEIDPKSIKAKDIMTFPIDSVEISESYEGAYGKMVKKGTYTIPVTENGKLIGILDFNLIFKKICEIEKKGGEK